MAISTDSIYTQLAAMTGSTSNASSLSNIAKGNQLQSQIEKASTDEELMSVCKDFEAYFLEQVFKNMQSTVDKEEDEGEYVSMFKDMQTQEYAKSATEGEGVGIAKMLYESMKRNQTAK